MSLSKDRTRKIGDLSGQRSRDTMSMIMNIGSEAFLISEGLLIKQAMHTMSNIGRKTLFVVDGEKHLVGVVSDGDIRRWILSGGSLDVPVTQICKADPKTVGESFAVEQVRGLMLELLIEAVPVIDADRKVVDIITWEKVFSDAPAKKRTPLQIPIVIMAGGKGTRLDPFTKILPKPLIPIGNKPIIEVIMDSFKEYGVDKFHVSVNHKARMIKSYFEEVNGEYKITYIEEQKPLGTAGSLRFLRDIPYESIMVTNCDSLIKSDYAEIVKAHEDNGNDITLVVSCRRHIIPYGICEIENGGTLRAIHEKPAHDVLVNTGMYVIKTRMLDLIPEDTHCDITDLIATAKAKGYKVGVFPVSETSWVDVGQWEEYHNALRAMRIDV